MTIRIASVSYLNTAPLMTGLDRLGGLSVQPEVPARLIDTLEAGSADLALISAVDLARSAEPLTAVPVGMIGCAGPTLTVRVFSRVEPRQIRRIHADTDSHTSAVLAQVLVAEATGVVPELVPFDAPGEPAGDAEAVLLIGDKVVTSPPPEGFDHGFDLGEHWHALTGFPFVYAVWACRSADAGSEAVIAAADLLDRQRRRNRTRPDWIVTTKAGRAGWTDDLARHYLGGLLRYEVGPDERAGLQRFLTMAADLGLAPRWTPRWLGDQPGDPGA